ncbi:MAG: Uma2 family endonuclease [Pyrinomonadaceae bacterium]|nr:Uma2 family endonuclease [Pyrinomonadaceae bacterium]
MATVLNTPEATIPAEERFVLHDVNWETYEQLLANYVDSSSPRFAYDRGVLEIMSPSSEHEELTEIITQLVYIFAEEWGFEYRNFGRTTFRRRDVESGFEPDSCFYIQSVESISGVRRIDLAIHPPPDVVIEVEMTSPALKKFPIYARMNVPEVWLYDGKEVTIRLLQEGDYVESEVSKAIPRLRSSDLSQLVEQSKTMKRSAWIRSARERARSH